MTPDNVRRNVAAEIARAGDSLRAASVLVDAGLLHDADALREDLAACTGFLARVQTIIGA